MALDLLSATALAAETGLAGRPLAGNAPPLPEDPSPAAVAATVVVALADGTRDLPSSAFSR